MTKIKVALTGGIGAGKSTVAKMLRDHGAEIVSGDDLGRDVLDTEPMVRAALIRHLGEDIVAPTGELNRKLIGTRVFADRELTNWLTCLTFPGIYARWVNRCNSSVNRVVVFDAALIFEWGIEREFEIVLAVRTPLAESVIRSRGKFTETELLGRAAMQVPVDKKASGATHVIENDGTLESLKKQVEKFWSQHILPQIS